ncbi:MAG: hypothetical protein ACK5O2_13360 [Microthrixaceae bacterium]
MSDTPQGDGWWQTSDGKWHPPDYDPTDGQAYDQPTPDEPLFGDQSAPADTPPPFGTPGSSEPQSAVPPPWSPTGAQNRLDYPPTDPQPFGTPPPDQPPLDQAPPDQPIFDAPQFDQQGYEQQGYEQQPYEAQPYESQPFGAQPDGAPTYVSTGAGPVTDLPYAEDPPPAEPGTGSHRPGEFGLPSEAPSRVEPKVVKTNSVKAPSKKKQKQAATTGAIDAGGDGMSPLIRWAGIVVAVLAVLGAGWYFMLRDSGEDTDAAVSVETTTPVTSEPGEGTDASTSTTAALPVKPTIAPGETLPVLEFNGTGDSVVAIDPPGPRVATINYTGDGPFSVTGKDANDGEVATFVESEGPYQGSVAVDFRDEQDSRSLDIKATGEWTIRMTPVEDLEGIPGAFTGTGDNVVLYGGDVGPVRFTHSGSGQFVVNTFEIRTRDIQTLIDKTGASDSTVEVRGPVFMWVQADGDWSATPGG